MLTISDLKKEVVIMLDGEPHLVLDTDLSKRGRGGSVLRTRLKNLMRGAYVERNFRQGDKFEQADVTESFAQFLYTDDTGYHFMDENTFEQFTLDEETIGDKQYYLKEGDVLRILMYQEEPLTISLPDRVKLTVTSSPPAVKGNTVDAALKTVSTETGLEVEVPMFVEEGETIQVDPSTGRYVSRK
jgi:elongation factor P